MQLLLQRWQDPESGLDSAEAPTYEVLLSFPNQGQPNRVTIGEVLPARAWGCLWGSGAVGPSPDIASLPQWVPPGTSSSPVAKPKQT